MANDKVSIHGAWASRWVFILAATGSAVGLGNIWKFPYMTGMYGGGAFVIMYLLCIFLVGLPIMLAETLIGRRGRQSPVNALGALALESGASPRWSDRKSTRLNSSHSQISYALFCFINL